MRTRLVCMALVVLALLPPRLGAMGLGPDLWQVSMQAMLSEPVDDEQRTVADFYAARDHAPLWVERGNLNARARQLLAMIEEVDRHGLERSRYGWPELSAERLRRARGADEAARLELRMTRAYLALLGDMDTGRFAPSALDPDWHLEPESRRPAAYLAALTQTTPRAALRRFAPQDPAYWQLLGAGEQLRRAMRHGGWPRLNGEGLLREGDEAAEVLQLRERLRLGQAMGVSAAPVRPRRFDRQLAEELKRFQRRHGLAADGILGPATRRALNVPADARWRQVMLNLECYRWLPNNLGDRYLRVNTARYELELVEDGRVQLRMPVIVGKADWQTPTFGRELRYLVVNPYWNVPESIVREELAARIAAEPDYLAEQGMELLESWQPDAARVDPATVDWTGYASGGLSHFPYRLRQAPGPRNPLGRVKFMLPNAFNVYLHDTPARQLFSEPQRALSHGCVRLAEPLRLARKLLLSEGWSEEKIAALLGGEAHSKVWLPRPIPVYIVYSTAWVGEDGALHYSPDPYGRDAELHRRLLTEGPYPLPPTARYAGAVSAFGQAAGAGKQLVAAQQ